MCPPAGIIGPVTWWVGATGGVKNLRRAQVRLFNSVEESFTPTDDMVFILGNNFPDQQLLKKALQTFYGIGQQHSTRILAKYSIFPYARVGSLPNKTISALTAELSQMTIENDLRRQVRENIHRLRDMGSYRGRRHAMGLPVRGQRTRTQIITARKLNRVERAG